MAYEKKLIEGKFPCGQVGAETRRERDTGSLPPTHFLHVWWARRPLTPSRAAILGSIFPVNTNSNDFLKLLGIVKKQIVFSGTTWTLVGKNLDLIEIIKTTDVPNGKEVLIVNSKFWVAADKETERRHRITVLLNKLVETDASLASNVVLQKWIADNRPIHFSSLNNNDFIPVSTVPADPSGINERIDFASSPVVSDILGSEIKIDPEDLYGYGRAYETKIDANFNKITVLDPTAGGGSIPFEAMRLGCNIIANDLNPVATVIEKATLEYPLKYGKELLRELEKYGDILVKKVADKTAEYYHIADTEIDQTGLLYYRTVTCPHCGKKAPLLNSFALSKKKDGWMVIPKIERDIVRFVPVRLVNGKGPNGEDPEKGTVKLGTGTCIHCHQAISSEEIKRQAQECEWEDTLYCIVAKCIQPKLDKQGNIMYYSSGPHKGELRTETVTIFREPTDADFEALQRAKEVLLEKWNYWEEMDLIPTDKILKMNDNRPNIYGMYRWCDMFTHRQLLGHLTAMETLHNMMPEILQKYGQDKGTAIITYLQYMIDKCLDYNSRQTRWEYTRGVVKGTFGRHDFSLKWTFGEMIYTGINPGLSWGKSQVLDAYKGMCDLVSSSACKQIKVLNGSAADLDIQDSSVDIICIDPPYYNNVQYAELSDYFYVWQKRTFKSIYPTVFNRRYTNKKDEAVANPVRDGSASEANNIYEKLMKEIFAECYRVMKDDGIMTMMFTHKTQAAWETLTKALIESGWIISSTFPVDSESGASMHQKDMAAAASSIFIACRKRDMKDRELSQWKGLGNTGVLPKLQKAVEDSLRDYEDLHLNSVDEMVASYGSALKVLSENWPVMNENDELVTPTDAMKEASRIVAQYQLAKFTNQRIRTGDIIPEAEAAVVFLGIYGLGALPYDDALSMSKSLNMFLEQKSAGYTAKDRIVGYTAERTGRRSSYDEEEGYYAPILKKGSKLRLALPEERNRSRIDKPQTEWDIMQGTILKYREGKVPVARNYLQINAAGKEDIILGLLKVWQENCGVEDLKKETERLLFGLNMRK